MTNIMEISEHCRLCLVKDEVNIPIFEDEGDLRQVLLKITACLPVKIAKNDSLPKRICDGCLYKLESFYQFWNTSVNSEKQLLQWLAETLNGDAEANLHALKQEPTDNLQTESQVFLQQQLAYQDTENYGEHFDETNYKSKKTSTKKERDREKRERERERKREEVEEEAEAPAPKRKRRAATKKPAIEIDDDDDDEEYVPPSAAITKTEDDSEEGNDDPTDDYGGDENASDDNQDDDTEPGPSGTTKSSSDAPRGKRGKKITKGQRRRKGGRHFNVNGQDIFVKSTRPYMCPVCGFEATTRLDSLYKHMLRHVTIVKACEICGKVQKSASKYNTHMMFHRANGQKRPNGGKSFDVNGQDVFVKSTRPYICPVCGFEATTRLDCLYKHMLRHVTNVKACEICGKIQKSVSKYETHMMFHRVGRKECDICGKKVLNYNSHKQIHVENRQKYTCDQCGKEYLLEYQLKNHINVVHNNFVHTCEVCGKSYTNKQYYEAHLQSHSMTESIICTICNKPYKNKKLHRRECEKRPRMCEVCGKIFTCYSGLKLHSLIHTGEKSYACHFCEKKFSTSQLLKIHIRIHTKEKPHICSYCSKGFSQRSSLVIHIRTHTGEKPYTCHLCPQTFASRSLLNGHQKNHIP